jgi:diguanylate cyclase (GGDEF)-like protein
MKVLIADDDPILRRLLESTLNLWGYQVAVSSDGIEASSELFSDDPPQIAILDWSMPGKEGMQLCREIRQRKSEPYIYIILLTGKSSPDEIVVGLEAGADDYLTKPFDSAELKVRLHAGERIVRLQEELISSREVLREQATRDHLTKLLNRASILNVLDGELSRANRERQPLGIAIADIDHFKLINDTYGHPTGDRVLRGIASALLETTRDYDSVGRYGGEEFLIVMPGCKLSESVHCAERLREGVARLIIESSQSTIRTTLSIGVAEVQAGKHIAAPELIGLADAALYQAKRNGRNRVDVLEAVTSQQVE